MYTCRLMLGQLACDTVMLLILVCLCHESCDKTLAVMAYLTLIVHLVFIRTKCINWPAVRLVYVTMHEITRIK